MNPNGKMLLCRFLTNVFKSHNQQKSASSSICESNLIVITPTEDNCDNINKSGCTADTNNKCKLYPLLPRTDDGLQQFLLRDSSLSRDNEVDILSVSDRFSKLHEQKYDPVLSIVDSLSNSSKLKLNDSF